MRTAIRATVTHDHETWDARLLEPLRGRDENGGHLSSNAVVLALHPDQLLMVTTGSASWHTHAQVHGMSNVQWVDLENQTLDRDELADAISARTEDGWALYKTLDDDPEHVTAVFTRSLQ